MSIYLLTILILGDIYLCVYLGPLEVCTLYSLYRAADTDYAKQNGGKWNFIVEKEKSIPQDKVTLIICEISVKCQG